ncbi:dihydrofolate reductase family protein [Homoserinibacter sp. GY 40078]|uniref:dihydrofolate reductase family protein n=1 Tax=Homoserinibacter sp. GY 40078 TaxID=2603275 RepID=UPI0011CC8CD3|nr:dihydrofolate reductase family protein [Homoserinibacter sp. GY 40078]TXK17505.1 pyrimidine reductase [Homoserinibacter sp. GY 40078]
MTLRPLLPEPGAPIPVGEPGSRDRLRALYGRDHDAAGIRINLIASVDGSARGDDGTSESLSSRPDRAVLGAIRAESDVVLIGAASLRAEGYLMPRTARLAVVTTSGDFAGASPAPSGDAEPILVFGPVIARERTAASLDAPHRFIELEADSHGRLAPESIIASLIADGLGRIVCEGGPVLASQLLAAGLVGELCLSTSPRLVGGGLPVLGSEPHHAIDLRLLALMADDAGGLYARWSVN